MEAGRRHSRQRNFLCKDPEAGASCAGLRIRTKPVRVDIGQRGLTAEQEPHPTGPWSQDVWVELNRSIESTGREVVR